MTEQVLNGFEIYYPAQTAMLLSWIDTNPRMAENQKKAESLDCSVYAVKDGSNEYILMQEFKIYHVFFNRERGPVHVKGLPAYQERQLHPVSNNQDAESHCQPCGSDKASKQPPGSHSAHKELLQDEWRRMQAASRRAQKISTCG